ncbi:hypothetical protein PsorP6_014953 [Peronosclerospora sorghi]|uniref:Uncharacterized protein n=1 Tax=Peronosclerospora sorghi TaxID=230839 RepID=A0ACC0VSM4_9STRA|nr:hypothetical protein PsorP6_014953 [Peronosclerospora sorghi]
MAIYAWFVARGSRPILITPTQVQGEPKSRGRTLYFHSVACPEQLFEPNGEPLREITFVEGEKPCFVQHRLRLYNKVTPPSLRPQPRIPSEISDTCMESAADDTPSRPSSDMEASPSTTSQPVQPTPPAESFPIIPSPGPDLSTQPVPDLSRRIILGSVDATAAPLWQLVQHSQYGVINREGPKFLEPDNIQSCELRLDDADPNSLVYSIPVMPNIYNILQDDGYDPTLPPDVDLSPAVHDQDDDMTTPIYGFSADSPLLPYEAQARELKALQAIIDEFLQTELQHYQSHDDVLAAIQVQPAYFRRLFSLSNEFQERVFKAHAVYRTVCAEPLQEGKNVVVHERLSTRFKLDSNDLSTVFSQMFPAEDRQQAALNSAISDLFLMIFAPGIYFDPVKIQALLPDCLPPKRVRLSPFLTWSDVKLLCLTKSDAVQIFTSVPRTPPHVIAALTHLATIELPEAIETGPSRLVCPHL